MMFKVGDYVMAIDDDVNGKISRISNAEIFIETEDGFEIAYQSSELVLDKSKQDKLDFSSNFSKLATENTSFKKRPKNTKPQKRQKEIPPMEVDLHIHKLVKNTKGLSNFDMLNIQIDTAKRQLDFAIGKRIQRVVFIHGVGQGVLKTELEFLFRSYDNIQISDGDYRKYGVGAMEIYITQKGLG